MSVFSNILLCILCIYVVCMMPSLNLNAWRKIGTPDHILEWIEHGAYIPFKSKPTSIHLSNRIYGAKEHNFIDVQIRKLLDTGAIKLCDKKPTCVLPIQCVPKKNGKLRMVLDCRYVNNFISAPKFKQEGIEAVASQIQPGDLFTSIDLEDGFHHVDMKKEFWTYFGMQWRGQYFVWAVLPFGMSASPWIFKKILEPVTTFLRSNGLRLALFVDEFSKCYVKRQLLIMLIF